MQDLQEMIAAMDNPSMMHAIIVHTPIGLATLGVPLVFLMAIVQQEKHTIRSLTLFVYGVLVVSAIAAVRSGREAMEALPPTQSAEVAALVQKHGDMAEWVAWLAGATALFIALSYIPVPKLRVGAVILALLSASATAAWLTFAAHQGGMLVYKHGAGTPMMQHWGARPPRPPRPTETETPLEASESESTEPEADDFHPAIRPLDMDAAAAVSYTRDIVPIMEIYCIDCHEGRRPDSDYDMTTAANIIGGGNNFEANVIPGAPDDSPLIQYVRGILQPQMPRGEEPIPEDDLHTLRLWIAGGAVDDSDDS